MKIIRLCVLPLVFISSHADAASISFYLDQSNDLLDDVNYAQVTISDSATTAGDIDFSVELVPSAIAVSGSNFGMQDFLFNFDSSLTVDASNIIDISVSNWSISEGRNAGGNFGKFGFQLSGKGNSRTESLAFSISGVEGDDIYSYALSSELSKNSVEYFATHIAGFDEINGVTSAKFAGSTSVVPVPAAVWLFGSGLLALVGFARRKQSV